MSHTYSPIAHRSLLAPALGLLGFCGALLAAPAAHAQVVKIEAEAPTNILTGGAAVLLGTASSDNKSTTKMLPGTGSPSGTGYVDYNADVAGLQIPYTAPADGLYDIVIRYESQYGFKLSNISIGKKDPGAEVYLNSTKTGPNFLSTKAITVRLKQGADTIIVAEGYHYYGVDYIQISPSVATQVPLALSAAGRVEAEAGRTFYSQAVVKDGDAAGSYSGTGYVSSFSQRTAVGSSITLPITVATAGLYQVAVGARGLFDGKSFDTQVATAVSAGSKLTTMLGTASTAFNSMVVGKYNLTAGTNTITITSQTSYLDVDYVDVTATTGVATAARASAEAQKALSAYPNPTNGQALTVSLELDKAQDATFDLVNSLGQRVSTATRSLRAGSNQLQLPTTGIAGGLYQLVVRRGDQPTLVQRIVVN